MASTFRADVVTALVAILNAQRTATPDLLRGVWSARPGAYNELPLAFVGDRSETITHDSGTRTRDMAGLQVFLVDSWSDSEQTASRLDVLVDLLVDRFTDAHSFLPNRLIEMTEVTDTELEVASKAEGQPPRVYPAVVISFARTQIKEGRQ